MSTIQLQSCKFLHMPFLICRSDSSSNAEEQSDEADDSVEDQAETGSEDDQGADSDADEFQQPGRRRTPKSAYDVDVSDGQHASDSEASEDLPRARRGKGNKPSTAPARRQPSRAAAAKVSLAETSGLSSDDDEMETDSENKESNRKRSGALTRTASAKRQKAEPDGGDSSMEDADDAVDRQKADLISDSEAENASDKENKPAAAVVVRYAKYCCHALHCKHRHQSCMRIMLHEAGRSGFLAQIANCYRFLPGLSKCTATAWLGILPG